MNIKEEREARGWSQSQLADRAGITRSMLSLIEKGDRKIQSKTLFKIRQAFSDDQNKIDQSLEMRPNSISLGKPTTIFCALTGDTFHIPRHPDRSMQGRNFVVIKVKTTCQYPHFAVNDYVYSDKAMNKFVEDGYYMIDCDNFYTIYFCIISSDRKRVMFKVENQKYSCDPRVDVWHPISEIKIVGKVVRSARNFDTSVVNGGGGWY